MKAAEVTSLVVESAARFGDRNPQQFKHLTSRLQKVPQSELAHGLLQVFMQGSAPPKGSAAQELAGRLLVELRPKAELDLKAVLSAALPRYELSVEQFPQYLGSRFGLDQVLTELEALAGGQLSEQERRSLQTMQFWLGRPNASAAQNGA